MFKKNNVKNEQQVLFSKEDNWTSYQKSRIVNGWPGFFHDKIFPAIDEEPYRVLFSKDEASCPNIPVNIIISLLILKQLIGLTDEEVVDSLFFDQRFQYAVHTLDNDTQKFSKNIIGDFRHKIREYYEKTRIDLFDNTMHELNELILEIQNVDRSIERMDSMMISASCKILSRIELAYTVNFNFIKLLSNKKKDVDAFKKYLEKGNKNEVIYRTKNEETNGKLSTLLSDSIKLYDTYKEDVDVNETEEFKILERLIDEQYDKDNKKPKDGKDIKPNSMQTPYDTKATYRYKYKRNIGYVANITEAVNDGNPMITDWDVAPNTKSDSQFLNEHLENLNSNETEDRKSVV